MSTRLSNAELGSNYLRNAIADVGLIRLSLFDGSDYEEATQRLGVDRKRLERWLHGLGADRDRYSTEIPKPIWDAVKRLRAHR